MPDATLAIVLASSALHACWNFAARKASGRFGVVWLGLAGASLLALPLTRSLWDAPTLAAFPYMAATATLNAVYFYTLAKAYSLGDLSEVYPVARGSGVVGSAVLSRLILHERPGPLGAAGVALVCLGLFLVTRRASGAPKGRAWPWALASGACIFTSAVVDKTAMASAHPLPYLVALFGGSVLVLLPLALKKKDEVASAWKKDLGLALLIGGGSMASYGMILWAMRSGPLGMIAAARESSVVFGALLGVLVLGERLSLSRAAGVLSVAAGLACVKLA